MFPGIVVEDSSVRTYPDGTFATSVLGSVSASGSGTTGLEYEYQHLLAGQTGITREPSSRPQALTFPRRTRRW